MADILLEGLTKKYPGGTVAVNALDLQFGDGEFFALLGPSGCGKTTLLRTIAGLENATGGRLLIGGTDRTHTPAGKRDVAMVFQDYALFPHMDVADNIAYPLRIRGLGRAARRAKAAETGAGLGLSALMERRPGQLSGGQQQRVALARAMACQPSVFLFDEPLSNLDARLRLEARTFLKRLQKELAVTTIFVTHDQAEALAMADRMAVMQAGRIRQVGTPTEVFHRPANTFVANFIGSAPMNLLPGTVRGGTVQVAGRSLPLPASAGDVPDGAAVELGARPEYVTVVPEGPGTLGGDVSIVENLGASALVTLEVPADGDPLLIQVMVPEGAEPRPGDHIFVSCEPDRTLLYDGDSGELLLDGSTAGVPEGGASDAAPELRAAGAHPVSNPMPVERGR
jgi:multiple sugar transport system ATP-binding protein